MKKALFQFGQVVIVEGEYIGVICKTWYSTKSKSITYDVYVRTFNWVNEYQEDQINAYIYNETLLEGEKESYV